VSATPTKALAWTCEIDTYPTDGGELQGDYVYAAFVKPDAYTGSSCRAMVAGLRVDGEIVYPNGLVGQRDRPFVSARLGDLVVEGEEHELVYRIHRAHFDESIWYETVETSVRFTATGMGDTVDSSTLQIDRAEVVIENEHRIHTTIEGRWAGANEHHLLMFRTWGQASIMIRPDVDDDGAFQIDYEHRLTRADRRRDFSLTGHLNAISPTNPGRPDDIVIPLLDGVDLRSPGCGCATAPPSAAWPLIGCWLLLPRRRGARCPPGDPPRGSDG
jgi:hypothetical protein